MSSVLSEEEEAKEEEVAKDVNKTFFKTKTKTITQCNIIYSKTVNLQKCKVM